MLSSSDSNHNSNINFKCLQFNTKMNPKLVFPIVECVVKFFKNLQFACSSFPIKSFSNQVKVLDVIVFSLFSVESISLMYFLHNHDFHISCRMSRQIKVETCSLVFFTSCFLKHIQDTVASGGS